MTLGVFHRRKLCVSQLIVDVTVISSDVSAAGMLHWALLVRRELKLVCKGQLNFCLYAELRTCVKVEVAALGSPSLISLWFLWT